jgi:hypothetical protein
MSLLRWPGSYWRLLTLPLNSVLNFTQAGVYEACESGRVGNMPSLNQQEIVCISFSVSYKEQ